MLTRLLKRTKATPEPVSATGRKYQVAVSGAGLLAESEWRQAQIRQIKRLYSVTAEVWAEHYLSAIEQFAELVQGVPASETHHHSRPGGLLDHTLECLLAGSRVAQGYMLPPNAEPEQIASRSDKWRFGVFVALLSHDLGKVVTDIEVVYRKPDSASNGWSPWHPWLGPLPLGSEYASRFKPKAENAGVAKGLHEKAAVSLLPNLLTGKAVHWLFSDPELLAQLLTTISHAPFGGGVLAEIVRAADRVSVGQDLGADTGVDTVHSKSVPLHEKLLLALRKLITDGELRQNRPGASVWITEDHTWAVSKKVAEALRDQLVSEGHKGVPQSPLRIFSVLQDHKLILPNPNNDPVWQAEVQDHERNWNQKLTFLRFDNCLLWATGSPPVFCGDVVPVDPSGKSIEGDGSRPENLQQEHDSQLAETHKPVLDSQPEPGLDLGAAQPHLARQPEIDQKTQSVAPQKIEVRDRGDGVEKKVSSEDRTLSKGDEPAPRKKSGQPSTIIFKAPAPTKDAAKENDLLGWLVDAVERRKVRVNEAKALVHVMDNYIALVSPNLFVRYLQDHPMRKKSYELRSQGAKAYKLVQRELEAINIHKSTNGQNIVKVKVTGSKSQSELSCYLIHKRHLPYFKKFPPNKAISLS